MQWSVLLSACMDERPWITGQHWLSQRVTQELAGRRGVAQSQQTFVVSFTVLNTCATARKPLKNHANLRPKLHCAKPE